MTIVFLGELFPALLGCPLVVDFAEAHDALRYRVETLLVCELRRVDFNAANLFELCKRREAFEFCLAFYLGCVRDDLGSGHQDPLRVITPYNEPETVVTKLVTSIDFLNLTNIIHMLNAPFGGIGFYMIRC